VITLSLEKERKKAQTFFQETVTAINLKHDEAKSALIYNDYPKARKLLLEAKSLIDLLPDNTPEKQRMKQSLLAENKEKMLKANKITAISSLSEVVNLANFVSQPINRLLLNNQSILAAGQQNLLLIRLTSKEIVNLDSINDGVITHIMRFNREVQSSSYYALTDNNRLKEYNNGRAVKTYQLAGAENMSIADVEFYNRKIYLLDDQQQQIFVFTKKNSQYQLSKQWLNQPIRQAKPVSFSIDGSIYILLNNGRIDKYSRGKFDEIKFQPLEPNLSTATKIVAGLKSDKIYLLDSAHQRLVVYYKNGQLAKQYVAGQLTGVEDFAVDESNQTIYLIKNNKILKFDMLN